MNESQKTINELSELRRRVAELECFEAEFFRTREDLKASQEAYNEFCNQAFEFIFEHDFEGIFTRIDSPFFTDLGYSRQDLLQTNMKELVPLNHRKAFDAYLERITAGAREEGLMIVHARDGRERIIEYRSSLIREGGEPHSVRGLARDVTDRLRAEVNLMESEKQYHEMLANLEDAYFEVDLDGNLTFFNSALCRVLGREREDLMGMNFRNFMSAETAARIARIFTKVYQTGNPTTAIDWEVSRADGIYRSIETVVSLLKNKGGLVSGFQGIARDVTERKMNEERLTYLAYHDALTGLHNRKAFLERLQESLLHSKRYRIEQAVLYVDLDRFKQVNDRYGHDRGDEVLKEVARRLVEALRETDYISRLGGDEFTVILTNPDGTCADIVARRLIENLSAPYTCGDAAIDFISPSIGISLFPNDGDNAEDLVRKADQAMYRAKRGGARFEFYQA